MKREKRENKEHLSPNEPERIEPVENQDTEVSRLIRENEQLNDKYLRLAAEFDNFRRRTLKERQELIVTAGEEIIKGILPVLDDFERALDMLSKAEGDNSTAIEGTELIFNKLSAFLTSKGLKKIEAVGYDLNTDFHEAIAQIPAEEEFKKGKIVEVVQNGYSLNGKIIRFAKVVIGQ